MAIDPISAGLGAAGLITQKGANKKAEKAQAKATAGQERIAAMGEKLFNKLYEEAEKAQKSGQFDPEKQIGQLEQDYARQEKTDLSNIGGAFAAAGGVPGDSEVRRSVVSYKTRNQANLDRMRVDLRRQSFFDLIGAYGAAGGAGLGTSGALYGQLGQQAGMQQQNPAGLFGAMMPFLGGKATGTNGPGLPAMPSIPGGNASGGALPPPVTVRR